MAYAPGSMIAMRSIMHSNLPAREKSVIRDFVDRHTGGKATAQLMHLGKTGLSRLHASHGQSLIRQGGEAVVVGGLLGAVNATVGLDYGTKKIPVDATLAVAAAGAAVILHRSGLSTEARNVMSSSLTVYAFRKVSAMMGKVPASGTAVAGESDEDPIIAAARAL